jgi:hypothetical protein
MFYPLYVSVAHKSCASTAICNCHPRKTFFSLYKFTFLLCLLTCAKYSLSAEYSAVFFLPNIRFRPTQENQFSVDHYRLRHPLQSCSMQGVFYLMPQLCQMHNIPDTAEQCLIENVPPTQVSHATAQLKTGHEQCIFRLNIKPRQRESVVDC